MAELNDGSIFIASSKAPTTMKDCITKLIPDAWQAGIGSLLHGIEGYRESFREAKMSIRLHKKFRKESNVSSIEEWGIIPHLDALPTKAREKLLAAYFPSAKTISDEHKETLRVFFECDLDMGKSASTLQVH
jgi:carbohydrate diacid regulator